MIIQRFNLNLIPNQSPVIVHVNQYDTGTGRLVATLYEGNEPYSPNGTAVIQGTKPDGHGFQYTATLDGNVVTADLTEQMSPVAGDVRVQIVVTESSGVTGTFVFIMRVQPSALPSDTEMSESDYQYIEEAIREAQEAVQTAQEATETAQEAVERAEAAISETQENAENSEAWAQGTRGGIPVDPTDPTYEHNAEYWAQYAERYAQGGLHYKGSIPFVDIPTTGMREGDMYNITDDFTTDSRFEEGAGIEVKGGTNIAWNSDNKWDVLALPPKTTFNGRSGSILPMAGDYDSKKILLSSALHIGGETQNDVQEALEALSDDGVKSFNGRSGSILPMAGDYDSEKILLASVLHIGGETQDNAQEALEALENNKADRVDNAVADNFAGLDADGNLKDSGKNASDFATPSDIAGQQSLLKDTVGWTGKNLLKNTANTQTINGVTFTVNANGSVVVNGTATANTVFPLNLAIKSKLEENGKYILSGCPSGGATNKYKLDFRTVTASSSTDAIYNDIGEGVTFTLTNAQYSSYELGVTIRIESGQTVSNLTFYPMIRKADITDPTYEPYHESVEVMYEEEIHGVNLLKNIATSRTVNGVTFTVNADGSVTANGTASSTASLYLLGTDALIPNIFGGCKLTGCPSGGSGTTYGLVAQGFASTVTSNPTSTDQDNGSGTIVSPSTVSPYIRFYIRVQGGTTVNNLVFKPMLRKADIEDSIYRPYNNQAIQNQLNAQGVLGAKNLYNLSYPTQTLNGITWTNNGDGTLTANGTSTATSLPNTDRFTLPKGDYIFTCPNNQGITNTNNIYWFLYNVTQGKDATNILQNGQFSHNGTDILSFRVEIKGTGTNVNNLVFYPMLRLASDPDDTYQPYAMTNRELTDKIKTIVSEAVVEAFSAHAAKWHDNANDCNVGFERTNDYRTSNMPTTGTASAQLWYNIMTVRESNVSTSSSFGYGFQIAIQTTTNSTMGDIYVRAVNGGATPTWSEWKKLN